MNDDSGGKMLNRTLRWHAMYTIQISTIEYYIRDINIQWPANHQAFFV